MTDSYFTLETGIRAAKSDAKHDFGSAYKPKIVEAELPDTSLSTDPSIKFIPDKRYMSYYIYADGEKDPLKLLPGMPMRQMVDSMTGDAIASKMKPDISNNYELFTFRNGKKSENEKDVEATKDLGELQPDDKSEIQSILRGVGVVSDVFVICDVAYSWLKYDLRKANRSNKDQIFWWSNVIQTGFDPAGKMAWHTGKPYGLANPNSNFRFCWQPVLDNSVPRKEYLPWPAGQEAIGRDQDTAMLCLRKKLLMITEVQSGQNWNYRDYSSYLMVFDEVNKKYVYASKDMAAKKYKMARGLFASYYAKAKELLKMCMSLLQRSPTVKEVDDYTLQYQMLAKRCGDMPQALACLDKTIKFQTLVDATTGPSANNIGLPNDLEKGRIIVRDGDSNGSGRVFQTNGNNMFVSYDQIAVAQALNYRVPIVMYEQQLGMTLFVSKALRSPLARLNSILVPYDGEGPQLVFSDEEGVQHFFKRNTIIGGTGFVSKETVEDMDNVLAALWTAYKGFEDKEREFTSTLTKYEVSSDETLQDLLTAYFSELATIRLMVSVGADINNFPTLIESSNQEFVTITGLDLEMFKPIVDEGGQTQGYSFNYLAFSLGISRIFISFLEGKDELSVEDVPLLVEKLSATSALHTNIVKKIKNIQSEYQDILVQIFIENVFGVEAPRGVVGNIKKINPSTPRVLNLSGRNPETKIFNLTELIFQHKKVMTPIVECLTVIPPQTQLYNVVKHFVSQIRQYVNKMVADENQALEKYRAYQIVVNKAIERLANLFEPIMESGQSGGAELGEKRGRFDEDDEEESDMMEDVFESPDMQPPVKRVKAVAVPNVFEEEKTYTDVYELLGWAMSLTSRGESEIEISLPSVSNLLDFDDFLKNIFNILTFYLLYNKEQELPDVLAGLNLQELYEKIGNLYLKVGSADLSESELDNDDKPQNLYLFNALESQVYDCPVKIYEGENVAELVYLLLNQVGNEGPFLYPGMEGKLEQMERDLPTLVGQLKQLDFKGLGKIMEGFQNRLAVELGAQSSVDVQEADQIPMEIEQPVRQAVSVAVGGRKKRKVRKTKDKKRASKIAKRNKQTKRKLKRKVRQTKRNRKRGVKQTRRKVLRRK